MAWHFCSARSGFEPRAAAWDRLNWRLYDHVLLDSRFVAPLVRHFATARTLLASSDDPEAPAMLLLEKARPGVWRTFQPAQAPLGLVLLPPAERLRPALEALLRALPGCALHLSILQQDPDVSPFEALGGQVARVPYITTARITLAGTFEDYWGLRGEVRRDIAKRRRRLERDGIRCAFEVEQDGSHARRWLAEYGRLEEGGWKGRAGTAVSADNVQGRFYAEMLERFGREARYFRLTFDGRPVAAQFGVWRAGAIVLLKMAYDEAYRPFAPGFLLTQDILRHLFAEGRTRVVEEYGRLREGWTAKWSEEFRPIYHVEMFRSRAVAAAVGRLRALRARAGGAARP